MSILDIVKNADFGSALDMLRSQAGNVARNMQRQTPGGVGGLLGAGALGALLGNLMSSDAAKGVALAGAGAVAWNFYKKWAASQQAAGQNSPAATPQARTAAPAARGNAGFDSTTGLVARAMIYAARSDGNIDQAEQARIDTVLKSLVPNQNMEALLAEIAKEPVNPERIAREVISPEQGQDVYRLSCIAIDPDQFMEKCYLDGLARALGISDSSKTQIEMEAESARNQLKAALPA